MSKLMSRRAFLKAAAVGTASVAGAGLLAPLGVVAEEAPAVQPSTDESGIRWDYEADVVVLGAGGSGLPAALRAQDEGLSVLIVEGNYDVGGRAALSGGNLHSGCGTEIQKKYGIEDSADQYYIDHTTPLTLESRYNDREYVRAVADYMAEAYEYILAKGVIIKDVEPMHQTDYTEGGSSPETVGRWTYCDQDAEDWVSYADGIAPSQGGIVNKYYEQIKMDPQTLSETISRYNGFVERGVDEDFGKASIPYKIEKGPFYAAWATPGFHDTMTGLRVNRKMQVMDLFGETIPGLYCCGESSGGQKIHGFGRVLTSGYIAGLYAATEG